MAQSEIIDGEPLDVDALLAIPEEGQQPAPRGTPPVSDLQTLRAPLSDIQLDDLRKATMYLAHMQHGSSHGDWQAVGAALRAESRAGRESELKELWLDYSRSCGNFKSDADALCKWQNVGGDKSGKGAIFSKAAELGWANPAIGRKSFISNNQSASTPKRYTLLSGADLRGLPPLAWRIRGVLPAAGLAALYGPSGSGKSFLALDMCAAIAAGLKWFNHRVKSAPVVYIALEGAAGIQQRATAWEVANGRSLPDDMYFLLGDFSLLNPQDVQALGAVIPMGGVVFIDTLNRAAPTVDENSSQGMGEILVAAKQLQVICEGLVVLVHHTGKNQEQGLRGHSSLYAALDAGVQVYREGQARYWKVSKSKDGADGQQESFSLSAIQLEQDADGEPVASCVVTPCVVMKNLQPKLIPSEQVALDAFERVQRRNLFELGASREAWRLEFYKSMEGKEDSAKRQAFGRACKALVEKGQLVLQGDRFIQSNYPFH